MENRKNATPELFFVRINQTRSKNALDNQLHEYADGLDRCLVTHNTIEHIKQAHAVILAGYAGRAVKTELKIVKHSDCIYISLSDTIDLVLTKVMKML